MKEITLNEQQTKFLIEEMQAIKNLEENSAFIRTVAQQIYEKLIAE